MIFGKHDDDHACYQHHKTVTCFFVIIARAHVMAMTNSNGDAWDWDNGKGVSVRLEKVVSGKAVLIGRGQKHRQ